MSQLDEITKALSEAKLPDWVESTQVETMVDHTGDPAVRVIVVVRADRLFPYTRFTISGEAA